MLLFCKMVMICSFLRKKEKQPFCTHLRHFAKIADKTAFSIIFSILCKSGIFCTFLGILQNRRQIPCFRKFLHFVKKRVQNAVFRMFTEFFVGHAWISACNCGKSVKYIVYHCLVVILLNGDDL